MSMKSLNIVLSHETEIALILLLQICCLGVTFLLKVFRNDFVQ